MRTLTIPEIGQLENGEIIPSMAGTIKKVFPQKTGTGTYGEWALQNFILTDGENEITCTWGGVAPLNALEGTTVVIESSETKHGLQGIKREIKEANGKTYEGVKLTDSCKIKQGTTPTAMRALNNLEGTTTVTTRPGANIPPYTGKGLPEARRHLMQACNLYNLCIEAVTTTINVPPGNLEHFQAAVSTLFIEGSRAGLVQAMPVTPWKVEESPGKKKEEEGTW